MPAFLPQQVVQLPSPSPTGLLHVLLQLPQLQLVLHPPKQTMLHTLPPQEMLMPLVHVQRRRAQRQVQLLPMHLLLHSRPQQEQAQDQVPLEHTHKHSYRPGRSAHSNKPT